MILRRLLTGLFIHMHICGYTCCQVDVIHVQHHTLWTHTNNSHVRTHTHSATSPALSDVDAFRFFVRTAPSDIAQVRAMAILLVSKFETKFANIIAGSDSYSRLGGEAFQAQAKESGITVVRAASFTTGSLDVAAAMARVMSGKCRATVVFGHADDIAALLLEGRKQGYTGEWIMAEGLVAELQRVETSLGEDAEELLNGVFGVAPSDTGTTDGFTRFEQLWNAQQSTANKSSSGDIVDCSNAIDSSE